MLRPWIQEKFYERISEYLYNTRDSVKVHPQQGMFNFRCYENAVQYAVDHEEHRVIQGIYLNGSKAILHYWNVDNVGKHLETTLGFHCEKYTYYPLRTIPERDYQAIRTVFDDAIDFYTEKFSSKLERFLMFGERLI